MEIRVLIYDDNAGRRKALEMLLKSAKDMLCVGTFENCSNVVEEVREAQPDVVLMDIDMPKVNGIDGLKLINRNFPDVLVIMQTVFEEEEKIFAAVRSGAHGYFLKKTPPEKLVEGIRDAMEGGAPMTPVIARKVLELMQDYAPGKKAEQFQLTPRELEILSLLIKGMSYKMIAAQTGVSWHTINGHCKKIYEKLHVHSATEAVAKAIDQRIV